ncbi:protein kinase domain-containing protein [Pseudoxanthomonas sp.]|jgi:serine/threonine-protein kinase|uniref:serine/threonine-protein kinase n=1 Tax=Pseudoxanthomonas sp. TaxID=1871049 RepID=UPI002E11980B|nr:protein kinase [Pseudoxanthomonas sp.]
MSTSAVRALALFDDYLTLAPAVRAEALASLAQSDPDTHRVLHRLLASDAALDGGEQPDLLDRIPDTLATRAASAAHAHDPLLGQRLGPWRIDRVVSIGGMGTVYEAQRADGQYRQRVAIKCIRRELSSPALVASFLRERETLAALEHPGIAPLIDGGVDGSGNPWFAMRYIQGDPIDVWCDRRRANLRKRVALLVQACDALVYAHAEQVLHQDIKPSNVMVTHDGQVQLLDFGLTASLTAPGSVPRLAMSQGYTAPEALTATAPQVTADVWSLGRMMYSLLGGLLPHDRSPLQWVQGPAPDGDAAPPPMSDLAATVTVQAARARGARSAAVLARRLAGDLDAIALRATAPQPQARYPTVAALRADLQAWLQTRPVQARAGGLAYRLGRAVMRHPIATTIVGTCVALLVAGGGGAVWHARHLAHEAAEARALSQVFEQTVGTATLSGLSATPMSSQQLLADAERRMRALDLQDHPNVQARGLAILARNYMAVGDYTRATALAREAGTLQRDDPANTAATLAALLNLQGKPVEAGRVAEQALAAADDDTAVATRLQLLTEQARSQWHRMQHADADRSLQQALALAEGSGDATAQAELRTLRGEWALRLMRFADADTDLQAAIRLSRDHAPLVAHAARLLAAHALMTQGRMEEGHAAATQVLADYRRLLGDEHPLVGRSWRLLAHGDCVRGQFEPCLAAIERAEAIVRRDFGEQHPEYADVLRVRALASMLDPASTSDGTALLRRADAILRATYPPDHADVLRMESMLARRLLTLPAATPAARRQQVEDVIGQLHATLVQSRRSGLPVPASHRVTLAEALMERDRPGDLAQARRLLEENRVLLRAYTPDFGWRLLNEHLDAELALREGDLNRAGARLSDLLSTLPNWQSTPAQRRMLGQVLVLRADLAVRRGDRAQARIWLDKALAHSLATSGPAHADTESIRATLAAFERTGRIALAE